MSMNQFFSEIANIWNLLQTPFITFNEAQISLVTLAFAITIIVFSIIFSRKVSILSQQFLKSRGADHGVSDSISKFVKIIITLIGIISALSILGFSLKSLAAVSAVLMVGIGFGLQNIAQNFISGIIILIERPVKVGDIVQVGTTTGKILDIRVRSTIVQTRDDISIIVPNSKLIAEEVINESFTGTNIRLHIEVGVAYGSDIELVKQVLLTAASRHPEVISTPKSDVIFNSFGDSSLDFKLRIWTPQIWEQERICSEIRFEISKLFKEKSIEIPFPQQDIYIKQAPIQS